MEQLNYLKLVPPHGVENLHAYVRKTPKRIETWSLVRVCKLDRVFFAYTFIRKEIKRSISRFLSNRSWRKSFDGEVQTKSNYHRQWNVNVFVVEESHIPLCFSYPASTPTHIQVGHTSKTVCHTAFSNAADPAFQGCEIQETTHHLSNKLSSPDTHTHSMAENGANVWLERGLLFFYFAPHHQVDARDEPTDVLDNPDPTPPATIAACPQWAAKLFNR